MGRAAAVPQVYVLLNAEPGARLRHYLRGIVGEWVTVAVVVVIGVLAGRDRASVGLVIGPHPVSEAGIVAEAAVVLGLSALVFRFGGRAIRDILRRQARGFEALLPRGRQERWAFAGLAVTAGICEEMMFRAFGIAYLRWLWPGASRLWVIVLTAAAFGLVHLYQGPRGVVLTGLVGALPGVVGAGDRQPPARHGDPRPARPAHPGPARPRAPPVGDGRRPAPTNVIR